jgi:DNA (cytosine-5)-methyltransferase 3A
VDQPEDRGILLRDVLDSNTRIPEYGNEDKARPLNALYPNNCGGFWLRMFSDNPNKQQVDMVAAPIYVGEVPEHKGKYRNGKQASQQYRVYSVDGKPVNITAGGGGAGGKTGLYAIPVEFDGDIPIKAISCTDGKTYTVYQVKDGQITIKDKQYPIKLADGYYIIRKLTVSECKRIQTVPEWYEFPVSDTQAYKMLGNGWTVEVIAHLIRATQADELADEQLNLFNMLGVM